VQLLDTVSHAGDRYGIKFIVSEIDLSHTVSSTRSIFGGTDRHGKNIHREKDVEVLNLSFTQTSSRSLKNFCKASNLRILLLDHCERLRRNKTSMDSEALSLLSENRIETLTTLSLVGTSNMMSPYWIKHVEAGCPHLETIYFTRKPGQKALGWDDIIRMQSMRDPVLLPCGHIADYETMQELHYCSLDRLPFSRSLTVRISPNITKLYKGKSAGGWKAEIVDHNRDPLDDKVLYHVACGEFYNYSTIKMKYHFKSTGSINEDLIGQLLSQNCLNCLEQFESANLRMCFTQSAKLDSLQNQEFENLGTVSMYSQDA